MIRAVIYARISRDKVGAGLGVERQEADCRKLAERLADQFGATVTIIAVLCDNDISAFSGRKRKDYERLCQLMRSGQIDMILTWHGDRLHRSVRELEDFIDLANERDIPTHTVTAGDYDLTTSNGRFQARLAGVIARRESEHRSERVTSAAKQRAYAGRYSGGPRPFGFEPDGTTMRPAEAMEIAAGVRSVLNGGSLQASVDSLNARGILTTNGKQWSKTTWKFVLLRPRNAALQVYQGHEIGPAPWDPIIDEADYRALVALLTDPARRSSPGNQPRWLSSLLVTCGAEDCGRGVTRSARTGRNKVYRCQCKGAGHAVRDADSLDEFIRDLIVERLSRKDAVKLLRKSSGEDTGKLLAAKAELAVRQDGVALALANGMNPVAAAKASAEIDRQVAALDARLASAADVDPLAAVVGAPDVLERWESLHIDQQRAIFKELLAVTITQVPGGSRAGGPADPKDGFTYRWLRGE